MASNRDDEACQLHDVERRVLELADRIGASGNDFPTFGSTADFGRPHIEVDERGVHYVVVERGTEFERITSDDVEEILWHVFQSVTFSLACTYELAHREEQKDCRRLIFAHQQQLIETLSPSGGGAVLRKYPFNDNS